MTTVKVIVAAVDFVAFNSTSTYGCPIGEVVAVSRSPRQNTRVTIADQSRLISMLSSQTLTDGDKTENIIRQRCGDHGAW